MDTRDAVSVHIESSAGIAKRLDLLMVVCLASTMPLCPPNTRALASFAVSSGAGAAVTLVFPSVFLLASIGMFLFSVGHRTWEGFGARGTGCAAVGYAVSQLSVSILLYAGYGNALLLSLLCGVWALCLVIFLMAWVRRFAIDFRSALFYAGVSCVAGALLMFVIYLLPAGWGIGCMGLLGLVAAAHAIASRMASASGVAEESFSMDVGEGPDISESLRNFASVTWLPLLGFLVCLFMMESYAPAAGDIGAYSETTGALIAATVVIVLCMRNQKSLLVITIEQLVLPVCIAICIVLGASPSYTPLFALGANSVFTPMILSALLALATVGAVVAAGEFSLPFIVGIMFSCVAAVELVGHVCMLLVWADLPQLMVADLTYSIASVFFSLVIIDVVLSAWHALREPRTERSEKPAVPLDPVDGEMLIAHRESVLDALAARYGLTARERELFGYMSRGYNSSYIAKELFISTGTVRTHSKHIYRKLQVGSREELLTLVEQEL